MAISINWSTKVISVPKADMTQVQTSPYEIRQLDIDTFRLALRSLEDDAAGMPYLHTHNHVAPITVGGVTLGRVVEIVNGYTVTFENGTYAVNVTGGNSNVSDKTNLNTVQVRSANSAGLQVVTSGSGLDAGQDTKLTRIHALLDEIEGGLDHAELMRIVLAAVAGKANGGNTTTMRFRDRGDTKDRIVATVDQYGNRSSVTVDPS